MEYFLILSEAEILPLGVDNKFGVFWSDSGMDYLYDIVDNKSHLINSINIKDEQNKTYSILQFLDKLKGLEIR
jgi:hypothetical protein